MSRRKPSELERLVDLWNELSGWPLWDNGVKTLDGYLGLLGFAAVEEAIVIAAERDDTRVNCFRYCCGILRSKLASQLEGDTPKTR